MELDWLKSRLEKAADVENALREAAPEICKAFRAERVTIYRAGDGGVSLVSVVQMGIESFGQVKVRIDSGRSVAGYVGASRKLVNIRDAYDDAELAPMNMAHKMFKVVDERTGFRTSQVLAAPILSPGGRLLGVVELFNREDKRRFPKACEADIAQLCEAIAPAFEKKVIPA